MAHFEAKCSAWGLKNEMVDLSPLAILRDWSKLGTDLSPLLDYYLIACKVEEKSVLTLDTYKQRLSAFLASIHKSSIEKVTANDIRIFLLALHDSNIKPITVNAYYRALNTFFNWLVAKGMLEISPMNNISPPTIPRSLPQPFSQMDIHNMLLLCSANTLLEVRNRAIILILLDTGLRLAELASLKLQSIDYSNGTIRVFGKGGKGENRQDRQKNRKSVVEIIVDKRYRPRMSLGY